MAATSYDSLMPYIATEVNGVPYPTAISAINLAVRRLCLESSCWFEYEEIPLIAGVSDYEPSAASGSSVVRNIKSVTYKDRELTPTTEANVLRDQPWLLNYSGAPSFYTIAGDAVHLMPKPTASEAGSVIVVKSAFVPALDATSADSALIDRFAETIIAGTKSRLMGMVGSVWENQPASMNYKLEFERGISLARIETETSRTMAGLSVTKRRFGK